ncbi:hypothetical protein [Saccharibacillus alkalitolerans]|uniref:Lipoprotein n=1 Tax=Saccharibacillus alkalitolerans TaxID=2705290 RepID=A0ABX0F0D0_9BACL|nr:hypothetical protein [Saccharibacillus alkalitolerans]NGZ73952.1 hypothetical protein [Saccharibacillus alkalitolerans]
MKTLSRAAALMLLILLAACGSDGRNEPYSTSQDVGEFLKHMHAVSRRIDDIRENMLETGHDYHLTKRITSSEAMDRIDGMYRLSDSLENEFDELKVPHVKDAAADTDLYDVKSDLESMLSEERRSVDLLKESVEKEDYAYFDQAMDNTTNAMNAMDTIAESLNSLQSWHE